jgi:oxygen-independent coproporphyrinogen-3 oxidase
MAGVYVHIPFCRQACAYCDFHFSTLSRDREAMPQAILQELNLRKDYLPSKEINSIYFGGGTPSILQPEIIQTLIDGLKQVYQCSATAEITLEANPDDLTDAYLKGLAQTEVNRLSIGIQSFKDEDLQLMNRAHNAAEARQCLDLARAYGFKDLSIDLIYGIPHQKPEEWQWQLEQLLQFEVPHFSAYALTVEPKTALAKWVDSGKLKVDEEQAAQHFKQLQDFASAHGYAHYELSNFARPDSKAKHNTAYWHGEAYLGLGPAAHSYNGSSRQSNVANNALYLKAIAQGNLPMEEEHLSIEDRYNEWLMTGLRLQEGLSLAQLAQYPTELGDYFNQQSKRLIAKGQLQEQEGRIFIPLEKRFFSDGIAAELFYIS